MNREAGNRMKEKSALLERRFVSVIGLLFFYYNLLQRIERAKRNRAPALAPEARINAMVISPARRGTRELQLPSLPYCQEKSDSGCFPRAGSLVLLQLSGSCRLHESLEPERAN